MNQKNEGQKNKPCKANQTLSDKDQQAWRRARKPVYEVDVPRPLRHSIQADFQSRIFVDPDGRDAVQFGGVLHSQLAFDVGAVRIQRVRAEVQSLGD